MLNYLLSVLIVLGVGAGLAGALQLYRRSIRGGAVAPPPGEAILREARGVSARIFVDRSVLNGPQARKTNRAPADLVLTAERLLVGTHHGRVLEVTRDNPGAVRCTGPRRLVLEGQRPLKEGSMQVRVELILDDAEGWAAASAAQLGTRKAAQLG